MKVLITGASGFIGSFIVEESLRRGMETWAAIRPNSSKEFLSDERIRFIELDLSNEETLKKQLANNTFDYVIHAAGATKCINKDDFFKVNTEGTKNLVNALIALKMPLKRFIFISSLSVYGPVHEQQPYKEICETDVPVPNTAYAESKLAAEEYINSIGNNFPYIILRPTGVYGPREKDYLLRVTSNKTSLLCMFKTLFKWFSLPLTEEKAVEHISFLMVVFIHHATLATLFAKNWVCLGAFV